MGYSGFHRRHSTQGNVWYGQNDDGTRAFAKFHENDVAFRREVTTYDLLGGTFGFPECLAIDECERALLLEDAGAAPSSNNMASASFAQVLWQRMETLHGLRVVSDSITPQQAVWARWRRLFSALQDYISPPTISWIEHRITTMAPQPKGWVHRDLRPVNVGQRGEILNLFDFGQSRSDFILVDAIPFFSGDWPRTVSLQILSRFESRLGVELMLDLPLFSVLYLLGSIEQSLRRSRLEDLERIRNRCRVITRAANVPLNLHDFFPQMP